MLATKPQRKFQLWWRADGRLLAVMTLRRTSPAEAQLDAALYQLFQPGDHHIAELELAMVLYGWLPGLPTFVADGKFGLWITPRR